MTYRKILIQGAIIAAIGLWQLSLPVAAAAGTENACGKALCAIPPDGCEEEASFHCAECPGWSCLGPDVFPCSGGWVAYLCHAIE